MKIILALLVAVMLGASSSYAVTKEPQKYNEGETYYEKVGATGNQQTGNPGYIVLQAVNWSNPAVTDVYYLWVDVSSRLMIASYPTISAFTSFPSGDWRLPNFKAGVAVGSQS